MNSVFEDKKGFSFITKKGVHFISYWNGIDGEWNFINLDTKCIEFRCERNEWNVCKEVIVKTL